MASFRLISSFFLRFAPCIVISHLDVVLNQWCTSSRFGSEPIECPFLCGHPQDRLTHLLVCTGFHSVLHTCLGQPAVNVPLCNLISLSTDSSNEELVKFYLLLIVHICHNTFNACRNGQIFSIRLVASKLKLLALHCGASRAAIHKIRSLRNFSSQLL